MPSITPDQHALNIARVVQREVAPNIVDYSTGYEDDYPEHWPATRQRLENTAEWSKQFNDMVARATGQHREDSDVDLLVVSLDGPQKGGSAGRAASAYMNENPPFLEVNIVNMTLAGFQLGNAILSSMTQRRAKQHLAGQADHYGVAIGMERMDYSTGYEDDYPEHWPATRQRLATNDMVAGLASGGPLRNQKQFNDMVARGPLEPEWNPDGVLLLSSTTIRLRSATALEGSGNTTIHRRRLRSGHGLDGNEGILRIAHTLHDRIPSTETKELYDRVQQLACVTSTTLRKS